MAISSDLKRALTSSMSVGEFRQDKIESDQYNYVVRKSNAAIRKARYSLTLQQQRILNYLICQLKDDDTHETIKTFDIKVFYQFMELGNKDYDKVRSDLKALADKSWWIKNENGDDVLLRFLNKVTCSKRSAKVSLKWHEDMLPFLQNLRREYTQYQLWYTMTMRSEYSVRLYELLKSIANKTTWNFSIEELKRNFMCENYQRFNDFKRRVIEPAVKEINEKTDLNVTYELFKFGDSGHAYTDIEFTISPKSPEDRLTVDRSIRSELTPDYIEGQRTFYNDEF